MLINDRVNYIHKKLMDTYPNPPVPLDHFNEYSLLIAVLLSAQCTDARVNTVTPLLWELADNPFDMAVQDIDAIQKIIRPCGLSPQKSKAIKVLSKMLVEQHEGNVPDNFADLESLPGVGHKTAGVVMAQAFDVPAFPVDTHIHRLAQRWGLSSGKSVAQTEKDLKRHFPKKDWNKLHLQIIFWGRDFCTARGCDGRVCEICTTTYPNRKHPKKLKKP